MSETIDLPVLWSVPGVRLVRARRTASGQLTAPPPPSLDDLRRTFDQGHGSSSPAAAPGADGQQVLAYLVSSDVLTRHLDRDTLRRDLDRLPVMRPTPGLLPFLGVGQRDTEGTMTFLCTQGANLGQQLQEWKFIGWEEAARVGGAVAKLLDSVHGHELLAGVLTPFHVQMAQDRSVALMVTGAAFSVSVHGRAAGRPLAPEVAAGGPPSIPADMFSLGVLLLELICGAVAPAETLAALGDPAELRQWMFQKAQREFDIPAPYLELIVHLTRSDPRERLGSGALVADRLSRVDAEQMEHATRLVKPAAPEEGTPGIAGKTPGRAAAPADPWASLGLKPSALAPMELAPSEAVGAVNSAMLGTAIPLATAGKGVEAQTVAGPMATPAASPPVSGPQTDPSPGGDSNLLAYVVAALVVFWILSRLVQIGQLTPMTPPPKHPHQDVR